MSRIEVAVGLVGCVVMFVGGVPLLGGDGALWAVWTFVGCSSVAYRFCGTSTA